MKYLKKFNEELKSSTYTSAANKLNYRHPVRSKALTDFSTIRLKEEELESERLKLEAEKLRNDKKYTEWKENIKRYSPFGLFNFTLTPKNGESFTDSFYLMVTHWYDGDEDIKNNTDIFLNLSYFLIPKDDEGSEKLSKFDWDYDDGITKHIWRGWLKIHLNEYDCNVEKLELDGTDNYDGRIEITDRSTALKFKRLMMGIFTSKEYPDYIGSEYPSLYNRLEGTLAESGISSDYGLEMSQIANYINTITVNSLYKTN